MARRGLSRLLVSLALFVGSLAWTGFTLQNTVFDSSRSKDVVTVLLDNDAVRHALLQQVVNAADGALPAELRAQVKLEELTTAASNALDNPQVRTTIEAALVDSHRYIIGDIDQPPVIDAALVDGVVREQLALVRPDLAAVVPSLGPIRIDLPTAGLTPIQKTRDLATSLTPLLAMAALCAAVAGVVISPDKPATLRRIGFWAVSIGAIWIALRYALPALAEVLLGDRGAIVTALAQATASGMGLPGSLMFGAGLALLGLATAVGSMQRSRAQSGAQQLAKRQARTEARLAKADAARAAREAKARTKAAPSPAASPAPVASRGSVAPAESYDDPGTYQPPAPVRPDSGAGRTVAMPGPHPGAPASTMGNGVSSPAGFGPLAPAPPQMPSPPVRTGDGPMPVSPSPAHGYTDAGERNAAMPLAVAAGTAASSAGVEPTTATMPTISIPLPRRERSPQVAAPEPTAPVAESPREALPERAPAGDAPQDGSRAMGATMPTALAGGVPLTVEERATRSTPRPAPNEWLGGFSMNPKDTSASPTRPRPRPAGSRASATSTTTRPPSPPVGSTGWATSSKRSSGGLLEEE